MAQQCDGIVATKTSKNFGKRCGRNAVIGSTFCAGHGGIEEVKLPLPKHLSRFRQKCIAFKTDGKKCDAYAIHGARVCIAHGGRKPNVKNHAKQVLLGLVDPALAELMKIIKKPSTSDSDRIRAIQLVLDRTGYHARAELIAEVKPWEGLVGGQILRDLPTGDETVVDAEIVDDPMLMPEVVQATQELARKNVAAHEAMPEAEVVPITSLRNPPSHLR